MAEHKVLVVEDEPSVRELVADVLRSEGYTVLEARDGVEAIRVLSQHDPVASQLSAIVLDMMLPSVDGLGVLHHLVEHGEGVPVVAMSASRQHLADAARAGARTILAKPFELDALLNSVAGYCAPRSCA